MRPGCMSCFALIGSALVVALVGMRSTAAPGVATLPPAEPGLNLGDEVRVYLNNNTQHQIWLSGRLDYADGNLLRLQGKVSEQVGYGDGHTAIETREVVRWVPRANVLYIEKTVSQKSEPVTRPAGQ